MFVNDKQLHEISFMYVKACEQPIQPKLASYLGSFSMSGTQSSIVQLLNLTLLI